MAQPFLPVLMHLDLGAEDSYKGIVYYSVAPGIGLIAGPVVAWVLESAHGGAMGYTWIFLLLFTASAAGFASVVLRMRSIREQSAPEFRPHPLVLRQRGHRPQEQGVPRRLQSQPDVLAFASGRPLLWGSTQAPGMASARQARTSSSQWSSRCRSTSGGMTRLKVGASISLPVAGVFLVSLFQAMSFAPNLAVFVVGILSFAVPHALILPETKHRALTSVDGEVIMNASYAFQASSGLAEFVTPVAAI